MPEPADYEGIIFKLAISWQYKLSPYSIYDLDDLVSEGWEVYTKCAKKYSDEHKVKFSTYLYSSVVNRFNTIRRNEMTQKKSFTAEDLDSFKTVSYSNVFQKDLSPERLYMVSEAVTAIFEVSEGFALMIKDVVPKELFALAKRNMRASKFKKGSNTEGGCIRLTKDLVEMFFNVKLKEISDLVCKHL